MKVKRKTMRAAATAYNQCAAKAIAQARREYGGQVEFAGVLAEKLGIEVSQAALSAWERGTRPVTVAVLFAVGDITGVDVVAIFTKEFAEETRRREALAAREERIRTITADLAAIPEAQTLVEELRKLLAKEGEA